MKARFETSRLARDAMSDSPLAMTSALNTANGNADLKW